MKECPSCGGQVRPSVIKCVHCGRSFAGREPATVTAGPTVPHGAPSSARAPDLSPTPVVAASVPIATPKPARTPDPWVTPSLRADAQSRIPAVTAPTPRALPVSARARRVDPAQMFAGLLGLGAAAIVYSSLALPWVRAQVIVVTETDRKVMADLVFRGSDSFAGKLGLGIAVAFAVMGLLWFWYGLDRGVHIPIFASPSLGMLVAVVGGIVAVFARMGYFFWDDAFVEYARKAGMSKEAMRSLLDQRPTPLLEVQALTGSSRFTIGIGLAALAALIAWWSQRRRDLG